MECGASPIDTATPQENQRLETRHVGANKRAFRARLPPILIFSTCYQQVGMSQSATPAMQNDMTTCLETFEKDMFSSFPIGTATPEENQRLETRHVDAEKPAFRTRLPPILTFLTHYQAGWNVTKCHACHAKRHDNFLGNLRKGEVLRLPT